ncbi:CaiB/BaiF CoA transferase family protein [Candidatus Nitrotoga sp. M5]|uniref:CaiB/BaiF CoA transferase family protein n=1 Tax=Candidatus Nitrotoga sp. M5 TaxID=2890409 RepID=UPI001EF6BDEE|nr:CoA transferase [Candidatus Nitrotoga sp. M5]CAH1387510.1 putative CoA transferase [Candidatus Nitrotoga sp. M5]
MNQCIDDLTIVEAGGGWPIALAGRVLAELGATVIKLETPKGDSLRHVGPIHSDGQSYVWHSVSAGKRSIALDLDHESERNLARQLIDMADVVLTDGEQFELGGDAWRAREDLIYVTLTPFGTMPPTVWKHGCEGVIQAAAGIIATTGFPGDSPVRAGCGLADHVAAFYTVTAILAALLHRDHSGRGQQIDMASYDCLITLLLLWLPKYFMTGSAPSRQGNRHLSSVPWNNYRTLDSWIMICTSTDAQWLRLCDLMGRSDLKGGRLDSLPERMNNVDFVDELVAKWVKTQTTSNVVEKLHAIGVPTGPILTVTEMLKDPHAKARGIVAEVPDNAGGHVPVAGPLCKMSETPGIIVGCGPVLDADRAFITERMLEHKSAGQGKSLNARSLFEMTIVESGVFGAGPFATKLMAELGMNVIKIESPDGDGMRHYQPQLDGTAYPFHLYNANKRSIVLDLKLKSGLKLARELIDDADVYLENLGPGVIERLGLGYERFKKSNLSLVYCSVSGFGRTGPYSGNRAYDTVIQAMSGMMGATGDDLPTKIGVSAADLLGPIFACIPIFAALHHRNRGGSGQLIDVSMYDVCASATQSLWPKIWQGGDVQRMGNQHQFYVPYGCYPTRTGDVFIGVEDDRQWMSLSKLLNVRDNLKWANASGRLLERDIVNSHVAEWTKSQAASSVAKKCQGAGIPASPVRTIEETMTNQRTVERDMLVNVHGLNNGELLLTGSPFKMSRTPGRILRGGPAFNDIATQVDK